MQVEPRPDGEFRVTEAEWDEETAATSRTYVDVYGNLCRRLTLPAGESTIRFDAFVEVSPEVDEADPSAGVVPSAELPDEVLAFTLPSRFCPSDEMGSVARNLFSSYTPGYGQVQAVCDWVHDNLTFGYGSSGPTTTAADVYDARRGVCRDFAHLAITFCRALNVPTRYAFGYLPDIGVPPPADPMDFCAWMEVYLGGRWFTFDPRNNRRRVGRVLIGRGRDALDVAMVTSFGLADLNSMVVWAEEAPEDEAALPVRLWRKLHSS
jgi:transglutaminase-like putative cysteine protease